MRAAQNTRTGEHIAIKCVARTSGAKDEAILREIQIQKKLQHPNILRLIDYVSDELNHYVMLELAPGGDLFGDSLGRVLWRLTAVCADLIAAKLVIAEDEGAQPPYGSPAV